MGRGSISVGTLESTRELGKTNRQKDQRERWGQKQRVERVGKPHVLDLEPGMTKTESRSTGGSSHHDEYERVDFGWDVCSNKK
jgi:hypothetical protein